MLDVQAVVHLVQEMGCGCSNRSNARVGHFGEISSGKAHGEGNTMGLALFRELHAGSLEPGALHEHMLGVLFRNRAKRLARWAQRRIREQQ